MANIVTNHYFSNMQPATCLNCGETIDVHHHFCPHCGQKTALHRLTLGEIGHDAVHYFTHADKGIFHLLKLLAKQPGQLARAYVSGQRKSYFSPLNFFLIVAAVCLFMMGISQKIPGKQETLQRVNYSQSGNQAKQQEAPPDPKTIRRYVNLGKFMGTYGNLIPITAIPLITVLIWLFYLGSRYNYAEHLVANMYIGSFAVLIYALLFIIPMKILGLRNAPGLILTGIYFLFEIAYRSYAYYHFINKKNTTGLVKAIGVNLAASVGWAFLSQYLISVYIKTGFWGFAE
jgi:hypothetical protein